MSTSLFAPGAVQRSLPQPDEPLTGNPSADVPQQLRRPNPTVTPTPVSGPPSAVLMQHGFFGGLGDFAQRVQAIVDAHTQAYRRPPSPQLTLDLARSQVPAAHFTSLFSVPENEQAAQARGTVEQTKQSGNAVLIRHDGYAEPDNPLRQMIYGGLFAPSPALEPSKTLGSYQALQTQHPWVAAGMLPLPPNLLQGLWSGIEYIRKNPSALTVGGETLPEYRRQQAIAAEAAGNQDPTAGPIGNPQAGIKIQERAMGTVNAVTTVREAQDALKKIAPSFFSDLPSSGTINQDWQKAIGQYQTSPLYFRQQTRQLAHDNHFGSDTGGFINAWQAKQDAIRRYPWETQYLRATPLALFAANNWVSWGPMKNLIFGDTKGFGWANVPSWGLGALVHTAGFLLGQFGGTIDSAKADASYVSGYMDAIAPKKFGGQGETEAQARAFATKLLVAKHPQVIHVFDPTYTGKADHGVIGALSELSFDLLLGAPRLTGEKILAGNYAAFDASRYANAKINYAYNALRQGDVGEATSSLEGGLGAERLNVATEQAVKNGQMTLAEYRQHVADLYHHGTATVGTVAAKPYVSVRGREGFGSVPDVARERGYLYHRASADEFASIRQKGLLPAKPTGPNPAGVYFANEPLQAEGLAWKHTNSIYLRVAKNRVSGLTERAMGESVAPGSVEASDLQFLGEDGRWHPLVSSGVADGAVFRSLRGKGLPTASRGGVAVQNARRLVGKAADDFENTLRTNKEVGATNHAADFVANVRQLFARAAPAGRRYIYDERLPQDVYNWARVNLKDQQTAAQLRDEVIRLRAADNVQGISAFGDKLRALYSKAHPDSEIKPNPVESSGPELEAESRSYLSFPKALETQAQRINDGLNRAGRIHREVIVGGSPNPFIVPLIPGFGESLMYKHAVADTVRRVVGGGGIVAVGPQLKDTRGAVQTAMRTDPALIRVVGTARSAAKMGENRWITGTRTTAPESYRTGERLTDPAAMTAAGGYLRHSISSDALKAYQASTPQDLGPLIKLVLGNRTFRALAFRDESYMQREAELRASLGDATKEEREQALAALRRDHANSYAELLYRRYKEIEEAGHTAGVADPLNAALNVLIDHVGPGADKALGQWVRDNKLDFPVRDGLVEQKQWDAVMQKWIGVLMTANKWNRGQLFDHVFYSTVKELRGAGWETGDAVAVAADLAKAQTVYHMLDFANMLQVEQNLRWLSYFATKHRLYWTWILKQAFQRPGLAAAVWDAKEHLDPQGNLNFRAGGHNLTIPAARLFWINAKEYPQTSPIVQSGFEYGKGLVEGHGAAGAVQDALGSLTSTSGNLITRDDQAEALWLKTLLVSAGKLPATSDGVTFGMSPTQKTQFQENVNRYSVFYRQRYGHWPTEQDAVKWALLHGAAQETWRTNLFVPILVDDASVTPARVKKEMDAYSRISDPARKRRYLDDHPEVAMRFGVSQDPAVFLHNNTLWDKYNVAHAELTRRREQIYQAILASGYTLDTRKQMSQLSAWWTGQIDALKQLDAETWAGNAQFKKGVVSDGEVVQPGPWGTALEGDPLASRAFVHEAFPRIGTGELDQHTVGATVVALEAEAARLRKAVTPQDAVKLGYPDLQHVHDRLSGINQVLAPFFGYPKDAPSKLQSDYYSKFVGPYIQQRDKIQAKLAAASTDQQDALRSQFRAWKDEHDHPVYIQWQGRKIKFPSVVQIGWSTLPAAQRTQALAQAAADNWAHVASYEKTMLGVPTTARVAEGWAAYATAIRQYEKDPANKPLVAAQKQAIAEQIDRQAPGFLKDWRFANEPKLARWQATGLYKQLPDRRWFQQNVAAAADGFIAAIKKNGHRTFYERAWRNAVEETIMPAINTDPTLAPLRRALLDYGPDFLNTLVSAGSV